MTDELQLEQELFDIIASSGQAAAAIQCLDVLKREVEATRATETKTDFCSVCAGTGKPISGKPCVCGGKGTIHAELEGLRRHLFQLEHPTPLPDAEGLPTDDEIWLWAKEKSDAFESHGSSRQCFIEGAEWMRGKVQAYADTRQS